MLPYGAGRGSRAQPRSWRVTAAPSPTLPPSALVRRPEPMAKRTGRPPHEPTEANRKQVKALAAYGVPQEEIGKVIGISKPTLERHYRDELDRGEVEANAKVAESRFRKATGEELDLLRS